MFSIEIAGTASLLLGRPVSTRDLVEEVFPDQDPSVYEQKVGIKTRHWVEPGTSYAAHGAKVLAAACADAGIAPSDLRRVILATSLGGDRLIPATVNALLAELGVSGTCDAFDINNACMGFLSAMDIATRSVATGLGPVGIVSIEHTSKWIGPDYHRSYFVFGDAAAAAVVTAGEGKVTQFQRNDGTLPSGAFLDHGAQRGSARMKFSVSSKHMTGMAVEALQTSADRVLDDAGLRIDDIDWVLPHQPNGRMLDRALDLLGVRPDQAVRVVDEIGSVGNVAIPFSLDRLRRTRDVKPGHRILILGVGTGISYGALLYEVPQ